MPTVKMICLANSRKHGGRCVAGVRLDGGGWVRPLSRRESGVLFEEHYTLDCGRPVRPLDVIDLELAAPQPQIHHPEDWRMGSRRWHFVRRASPEDLDFLMRQLDPGPELIATYNDCVLHGTPVARSLTIIQVAGLRWRIDQIERRRTRAVFIFNEQLYKLSVTDPVLEGHLAALPPGEHPIQAIPGFRAGQECVILVSLGEPFSPNDADLKYCYKIAATILPCPLGEALAHTPIQSTPATVFTPLPRPPPPTTKQQAFELFERGLSIAEVARRLGRAVSTTTEYLAEYLQETARAGPERWVNPATFARIRETVGRTGPERLKPIFEALGGTVPYDQIRLALACLRKK